MHVLMVNGSPNEGGCTYTALTEIANELGKCDVTSEIIQIGKQGIRGCIGWGKCREKNGNQCVFRDDVVNVILEKAKTADGFVFGSPVYFASANGSMVSLMDRLFYAGRSLFRMKPGVCIVSARRAGTTAAYDQLNKYIEVSEMIMVPSPYWNMVHGHTPEEVKQDEEGMWIMRSIGQNMGWMLNILKNAQQNNICVPEALPAVKTNFIR